MARGGGPCAGVRRGGPVFPALELTQVRCWDVAEMDGAIAAWAHRTASSYCWALLDPLPGDHRAGGARRLPAVYPYRFFATSGGLLSYGIDLASQYRQAGAYADRILRGAKPAELPVQLPTKFELVIKLKTAKALGIDVPRDAAAGPTRRSNESGGPRSG